MAPFRSLIGGIMVQIVSRREDGRMADAGSSIFNEQARNRLQSPDDLDRYIRVTSPSVWVMLGAVVALVLGLLAWGIFGSVATTVTAMAVRVNNGCICFLEPEQAEHVEVGNQVLIDGQSTVVDSITRYPLSREELADFVPSDYLAETVIPGKWAYVAVLKDDLDSEMEVPLVAVITTDRVAPISLVLGQ